MKILLDSPPDRTRCLPLGLLSFLQLTRRPSDMQLSDQEAAQIEVIARETDLPVETVEQFYVIERTRLERISKGNSDLPLLAGRIVARKLMDKRP